MISDVDRVTHRQFLPFMTIAKREFTHEVFESVTRNLIVECYDESPKPNRLRSTDKTFSQLSILSNRMSSKENASK